MRTVTYGAALLCLVATNAWAGQYDGQWDGSAPAPQPRCVGAKAHLVVKDNNITASLGAGGGSGFGGSRQDIPGTINPDGTFTIGEVRKAPGKFSGNNFTLALPTGCGILTVTGTRVGG